MSAPASSAAIGSPDLSGVTTGRVRELVTPEGVDLRLVLPDAGERVAAFMLDIAIIVGSLIGVTILIVLFAAATSWSPAEVLATLWILVFFFLRNFYFVAFELRPRAATPGKRALGLRVAMRNGGPITAEAIFARNAMRELELFLPLSFLFASGSGIDAWITLMGIIWCAVFVLFPLFNRDRLRVGDLVAGTWVVRAPRRVLDSDLAGEDGPTIEFTAAALEAYGIKELNVLEDVLRQKDPAVVRAVAERIRAKIGVTANEPDLEFLQAYYTALRAHLEGRLLFGRRRKDKYDKS
ncbi:MAG: RDD family protein [Rhizomicrobium sp.]|jgi:uncharacterized RDD family membrane protein YckC